MEIIDKKEQVLRTQVIPLVKVRRMNHIVEEATEEREVEIREKYPQLDGNILNFENEFFFIGEKL